MALILMLLMIVTPMSVYAQAAATNYDTYNNAYNYQANNNVGTYGPSEDLGEAISVNVVGYEPASLVSTEIEGTDVPVYVFLQGATLGTFMGENAPETAPFFGNPSIKKVVVTPSGSSSSYVRGTQYMQPNKGALTIENLGYVIVTLRQIKDETKVPEEINLNMSARIYFDFMRGFAGASSADLALKELNEVDWKGQSYKNSFWNGKGYLRLVDLENNRAKIQVYDSAVSPMGMLSSADQSEDLQRYNERGILLMSTGDVKTITIPGSSAFFHDQVRIKLNKIGDIQKEVELKVESLDGTNYKTIAEDMSVASGSNWKVFNILEQTAKNVGEKEYSVILRNGVGEKRTLTLTKKQETPTGATFPETTENNLEENKKKICDESFIVDEKSVQTTMDIANAPELTIDTTNAKHSARKLYCTAISHYEQAVSEDVKIRDLVYKGIGESYSSLSDFLDGDNVDTARSLALYYLKRVSDVQSVQKSISTVENNLFSKSKSESVYLEDDDIRITLLDVIVPPVNEKTTATIENKKTGSQISYNEGDSIFKNELTIMDPKNPNIVLSYWKIITINSERVVIQKYVQGKTDKTLNLDYGKNEDVDGYQLTLTKVESKKSAYVTIMPGGGDTYSESSFMIHIPIEKRLIQWTPEQIDKMINETTKQMEILDKYINQLNNMITSWKYVCFATFALLTIKNSFLAGSDRNMARKDVMPYYNKKCEDEVALGKTTFDKCMNNYADEIESKITSSENLQQQINDFDKLDNKCDNSIVKEDNLCMYPNEIKAKTKDLKDIGINDPVDREEWIKYYKCKLYQNEFKDTQVTSQFNKDCDATIKTVTDKTNAMNLALQQQTIPADLKDDKAVTKFNNEVKSRYRAKLTYDTNYGDPKQLESDITEINTKLGAEGISGFTKENVVVQAYSSNKDEYSLISATDKGINTLSSGVLVARYQNTESGKAAQSKYKTDCEKTPESASCKETLANLNKPLQVELSDGRTYDIFTDSTATKFYAALETVELTDVGERKDYAPNAKAQFDDEGKPYCIPTGEDGNFVKVLSWYATGDPNDCEYWNVGLDGEPCSGDDLLKSGKDRITEAIGGKCTTLTKGVGSCKSGNSVKIKGINFVCDQTAYRIAQIGQQTHCQDVMDPNDCKKLFAVCDPVMCPPSRFNLGGKYPLTRGTVVDTGIIGSIVLGLPNFPEDPVPVCLPGILAGLRSIRSLLEGFKECLAAAKINHENIGICDKIRSVGICKLFWQELINWFKLRGSFSAMISGMVSGATKGDGGEYLNFNQNINAVSDSVKYFTTEYGSSAFASFKGRSTTEMGSAVCEAAIYGKFGDVGDFVDQLAEPENPPQFTATFDEAPWAVTAGKTYSTQYGMQSSEQSIYSVYYFLYAGNIPDIAKTGYAREGIKYAVYLRDDLGRTLPVTVKNSNQLYDTVPYDGHRDVSVEKLGPRGMNKICVYINGKEDCGFGKVSTEYSINSLNDMMIKSDAKKSIASADQCVSDIPRTSPSLGGVILPQEYGLLSSGIVRTCSVLNPGQAAEPTRWQDIGTCGQDKQKNNLGKCWIDTKSVSIKNLDTMEDIQKGIISTSSELKTKVALSEAELKNYFSADKAKVYYNELEAKKDSVKGSTKEDDLITLLIGGTTIDGTTVTYNTLIIYSLDPSYKILAQISTAEIYVALAGTISIPKAEVTKEEKITQSTQPENLQSARCENLDSVICLTRTDCDVIEDKCVTIAQSTQEPTEYQSHQEGETYISGTKTAVIPLKLGEAKYPVPELGTLHIQLDTIYNHLGNPFVELSSNCDEKVELTLVGNSLTQKAGAILQTVDQFFPGQPDSPKSEVKIGNCDKFDYPIKVRLVSANVDTKVVNIQVTVLTNCESAQSLSSISCDRISKLNEKGCYFDFKSCKTCSDKCKDMSTTFCLACRNCDIDYQLGEVGVCKEKLEKNYWFKTYSPMQPAIITKIFFKSDVLQKTNDIISLNSNTFNTQQKVFGKGACVVMRMTNQEYESLANLKVYLSNTKEECDKVDIPTNPTTYIPPVSSSRTLGSENI